MPAAGAAHAAAAASAVARSCAFLLRLGLLGVVARLALHEAGGVEEAQHAVGRLRALGEPGLDLLEVERERGLLSFGIIGSKVPTRSMKRPSRGERGVGDDDAVDRDASWRRRGRDGSSGTCGSPLALS